MIRRMVDLYLIKRNWNLIMTRCYEEVEVILLMLMLKL